MLFANLFPRSRRRRRLAGRAPHHGLRRQSAPQRLGCVPSLEGLEDRFLPSTFQVLNLNDSGRGSLRQAILDADGTPGPNLIRFADGLQGTITLTSGELDITNDLTIQGPGADQLTVSGGEASRVFDLSASGIDVTLRDLTIADGLATDTTVMGPLGPVTLGGGILNEGADLTLARVAVNNNQAVGANIGGGGGVANVFGASLTIEQSAFADNVAAGTSVDSPGGGIFSDAASALTVRQSTFTGNRALDGGAISVWGGSSAAVSDSLFTDNLARGNDGGPGQDATPTDNAGGIFATDESILVDPAGSTLTVASSTFTGNVVRASDGGAGGPGTDGGSGGQAQGGAISIYGVTSLADVSDSVFTNNRAIGGNGGSGGEGADGGTGGVGTGGAISQADATFTSTDCTFNGNEAIGGTGGAGGSGGAGGAGGIGRAGALVHTVTFGTSTPVSTLSYIRVQDNQAIGGAGGVGGDHGAGGAGGNGQGGGLRAVLGTFTLSHGLILGNQALGGPGGGAGSGSSAGGAGGNGQGGGLLDTLGGTMVVSDTAFRLNRAQGGVGAAGGDGGNGQGGGIFNDGPSPYGAPDLTLQHCRIVLNEADGGDAGDGGSAGAGQGGGVYVSAGSTARADMATAIRDNHASTSDDDVFGDLTPG
jgi:hypothetical protein